MNGKLNARNGRAAKTSTISTPESCLSGRGSALARHQPAWAMAGALVGTCCGLLASPATELSPAGRRGAMIGIVTLGWTGGTTK